MSPNNTGKFRFWFAEERWEWSDQILSLYGYAPGAIEPSTELLLSHKHPDDRDTVATTLAAAVTDGEPFSSRHRIIDAAGATRDVIVVGDRLHDDTGTMVGTTGYFVDLTELLEQHRQHTLEQHLPAIVDARAPIEQAKGTLMLTYGIDAEQAFAVLRWRSQETNIKLREFAARLLDALTALGSSPVGQRTQFDHLLLTVHEDPPTSD